MANRSASVSAPKKPYWLISRHYTNSAFFLTINDLQGQLCKCWSLYTRCAQLQIKTDNQ